MFVGVPERVPALAIPALGQCEEFQLPPTSVAYEEDPVAATALWQKEGASGNYSQLVDQQGKTLMVVMRPKAQWGTSLRPDSRLYQHGAVFLHAPRAKSGERMLVCAYPYDFITHRRSLPQQFNGDSPDLSVQVIRPATLLSNSERPFAKEMNVARLLGHPFGTVRIFAGQVDPNDDSHFTIQYETPTGKGTIDGYLQPDEHVRMQYRDGPALAPTTSPTTLPVR